MMTQLHEGQSGTDAAETASVHSHAGIFLRGMAMGAADLVPGVSGGTIALITGIYARLVRAIARCDITALALLVNRQWGAFWRRIDGLFLLVLVAGIGSSIVLLARVIRELMLAYPLPLWAFFFGLVLVSGPLLKHSGSDSWLNWILAGLGVLFAASLAVMPPSNFLSGYGGIFLGGAIAICAMILPGISGSFILLLLGLYPVVITAVTEFNLPTLGVFAAGCGMGLLAFSRLLHWILIRYQPQTMSLLRGFLLGSLVALWPWQQTVVTTLDRHGNERVLQRQPVSPMAFGVDGADPQLWLCLMAAALGASVVMLLHHWPSRERVV